MASFDVSISGKSLNLNFGPTAPDASPRQPEPRKPEPRKPEPRGAHSAVLAALPCHGLRSPVRSVLGRRGIVACCQAAAVFDLLIWQALGRGSALQLLVLRLLGVALCSCVCVDVLLRFHACLVLLAASLHFEALWLDAAPPDRVSVVTLAAALCVTTHKCLSARRNWLASLLIAALASTFASTLLLAAWLPDTVPVGDVLFLAFAAAVYALLDAAAEPPPPAPA